MRIARLSIGVVVGILVGAQAFAQITRRVSLATSGAQGDSGSQSASMSADGRYVAFASFATNFATDRNGDDNGDVFVRDLWTGTTERVSVDTNGLQGNAGSGSPSISADGRCVAFFSNARNLVPGYTNGFGNLFLRDRQSGTTEIVSVGMGGAQADAASLDAIVSADGRFVVFDSIATNLVLGDTNGFKDVFLRDRQAATMVRVSLAPGGAESNGDSAFPSISADDRYVAYASFATNLVPGDTNGAMDVFLLDLQTGTTELVSVSSLGVQGNAGSYRPSVSSDGRFVAFSSDASNLVAGDTNGKRDVFVRDRLNGTTERVSISTGGVEGEAVSGPVHAISADGRFVAFSSSASTLVPGDTNGKMDMFLRDRQAGTTERVSVDSSGAQSNGSCDVQPAMSSDGRFVAFSCDATNLVAGDTNGAVDVFLRDRESAGFSSLCDPGVAGVIACPCANPPSGAGRGCDNSAATGGAVLSAAGAAYLTTDTLVLTTSGEKPTATSVLLQGTAPVAAGAVYGQGVRCVGGSLRRLFTQTASGGSITVPGGGGPPISARSAAKGDPISPGQSRWYLVYYRDPILLGGCPPADAFNTTQTGRVAWSL